MFPLARSRLTSARRPGHCSGKSCATTFLSAWLSWSVTAREGEVERSGRSERLIASLSESAIGPEPGVLRCGPLGSTK
jgi:hypothetical protein